MTVIAHRGASGLEPANTVSAFTRALEIGCDMIETDVHVCADGEAVIHHDSFILNNGRTVLIKHLSLEELSGYDAGGGQGIPSLNRILNLVDGRVPMNLELKSPGSATVTARAIRQAVEGGSWKLQDFLVTSFDHHELEAFRRELPECPRGALIKCLMLSVNDYLSRLGAGVLVTSLEFVRPSLVDEVHAGGRKILVYTVNTEEELRYVHSAGVDGAITNYPDRAHRVLDRL